MLKWRVRFDMEDPRATTPTPNRPSNTHHPLDSLKNVPPTPPNKSFLHQNFISGSSPSLKYYDGRFGRHSLPPTPSHGPLRPCGDNIYDAKYYESQGRYSLPPPTYEEPLEPSEGESTCYNGRYSLPLPTYEEPFNPVEGEDDARYYECQERLSPPPAMYEVPLSPSQRAESVYEACPRNSNPVEVTKQADDDGGGDGGGVPALHYACPGNNTAVQGPSTTTTTTTTSTTTAVTRSNSGYYGRGWIRPRPMYYFGTLPSVRPSTTSTNTTTTTHYSTPRGNRPVVPRPPLPSQFLLQPEDTTTNPLQHYDFPKKQKPASDPTVEGATGDEYEELSPYVRAKEQRVTTSKEQKSQEPRSNMLSRLRAFISRDQDSKGRNTSKESKKCKRSVSLRKHWKEDKNKHKTRHRTEPPDAYQSLDLPRDNLKDALDLSEGRRKEEGRLRGGDRWKGLFHTVREKLTPQPRPSVFWVVLGEEKDGELEGLTRDNASGTGGDGGGPAGGSGGGSPVLTPLPPPLPPPLLQPLPETQSPYHTFPRCRPRPPHRPLPGTSPLTSPAIPDGAYVHLFPYMVSW